MKSDTPQADDLSRGNHVVPTEWAEQLERERDEAREIIRIAKTKFCEEGSDGNVASEMFSILSGAK